MGKVTFKALKSLTAVKQNRLGSNEMNKKIKEIMKTDVYTVSDEATIKDVLQVLVERSLQIPV